MNDSISILQTERLRLRTIVADDAAFYLEVLNDPGFLTHIGDRGVRTLAAARDAITAGPVLMQATLGHSIYLVELKEGGTPIGMCGLIKRDALDGVDLGYAFLPAWRGRGYAIEAAAACVEHARTKIGLSRLLAITSPANDASNALLEKLGMRFEKLLYMNSDKSATRLYQMSL